MFEIVERTTVKQADGTDKVLLPGRITDEEAALYGLAVTQPAPVVEAADEPPAPKARKKG